MKKAPTAPAPQAPSTATTSQLEKTATSTKRKLEESVPDVEDDHDDSHAIPIFPKGLSPFKFPTFASFLIAYGLLF